MNSANNSAASVKMNGTSTTNGIAEATTKTNGNGCFRDDDSWKEISIDVPWGVVAGKWWGPLNRQPILALHGWQDNAGTFDRLCPLLPAHIPILCIDLPGHGKSSHYPMGMQYFIFWDGICLIRRIVRRYGWENVTLLGHSLGGALTFMYAASYPNEVEKLINIDIAGPTVRSIERSAETTGWALDKLLDYENLPQDKRPCYNYEEMIKLVVDAYDGSVDEDAAKVLMRRGMAPIAIEKEDGFNFARDLRLKVSLLGMFTGEQVLTYAKRIRCKVLNIRAEPGMTFQNPQIYIDVIETLRKNAELVIFEKVPGTHHLHLVTPERVAPIITDFILKS
ncbi:probable serine hydrolase [Anastrepha obliqua]|uniref:probable serine hydrolase n=1 Tax=Anastrepha ludens TaxID=28586 RepID=UPI0023B13DC9|nr:probable serine hydrolase [Anastrepha ludens]XP_054743726.1 probable serine hydrolase [Anastrepha obliqua]